MKVDLVSSTPDPEAVCAFAARMCYSDGMPPAVDKGTICEDDVKLLRKVLGMGHESVAEHASFTYSVDGISRACSHQLVRHRVASYSQQSQRYVTAKEEPDWIVPESVIKAGKEMQFLHACHEAFMDYCSLVEAGVPAEDARFLLPNATPTRMTVTMNARELRHFFALRCCQHAQWEIRAVAQAMLAQCSSIAPALFENSGPGCVRGRCPEGERGCNRDRG